MLSTTIGELTLWCEATLFSLFQSIHRMRGKTHTNACYCSLCSFIPHPALFFSRSESLLSKSAKKQINDGDNLAEPKINSSMYHMLSFNSNKGYVCSSCLSQSNCSSASYIGTNIFEIAKGNGTCHKWNSQDWICKSLQLCAERFVKLPPFSIINATIVMG